MSNWVGYAISVNCGEPLGCYQGTILEADGSTITLTKAFRNGFPYPKSQVTLNAADIKDLKIIESRAEPAEQTHSTVAVTKGMKKAQRATVCENLQANPTSSGNQAPPGVSSSSKSGNSGNSRAVPPPAARSKPMDIQTTRTNKNGNHAGSYGNTSSTPKSRSGGGAGGAGGFSNVYDKARRRNEACFGELADAALDNDFDFEGNLALFNKRALWEELRHAHKPDVVRQADDLGKFRHDQNVLAAPPAPRRSIRVPDELRAHADYVTDEGLSVPGVRAELRALVWAALARRGLRGQAQTLLARAAADVALRLVGGGRRLDPRNAHQRPTVVALVGPHAAGAAGLQAARLLASHGARAHALLAAPLPPEPAPALARELAALAPGGVQLAHGLAALPTPDLVLLALYDPVLNDPQDRYQSGGAAVGHAGARLRRVRGAAGRGLAGRRLPRRRAGRTAGRAAGGAGRAVPGRRVRAARRLRGAARGLPPALRRLLRAGAAPGHGRLTLVTRRPRWPPWPPRPRAPRRPLPLRLPPSHRAAVHILVCLQISVHVLTDRMFLKLSP